MYHYKLIKRNRGETVIQIIFERDGGVRCPAGSAKAGGGFSMRTSCACARRGQAQPRVLPWLGIRSPNGRTGFDRGGDAEWSERVSM